MNKSLGVLDADIADAIAAAADEVASGAHDDQFPIDVFQTGSGTSSNMNANEVIATLASRASGQKVHPNDHVNASQSSNDVFPTTIHLAATEAVVRDTIPGLDHLGAVLNRRAQDWKHVVKAGRTHLMDAVPITLGQEAGGWATQCSHGTERLRAALPRLGELPIGGTAVGTGINTPEGFGGKVVERAAPGHRHPRAHRGPRPHRGPGRPRRARRDLRGAAHRRRQPLQDRQRPALDLLGPVDRPFDSSGRDDDQRRGDAGETGATISSQRPAPLPV